MNECVQPNNFVPPVSFSSMNLENINGYNTNVLINEINKFSNLNATAPIFYNPLTQNISYSDPTPKSNIPDGKYPADYIIWDPYKTPTAGWVIASDKVKLGRYSGENNQGINSVAIGVESGNINQQNEAVSIGKSAGQFTQGEQSVALGSQAGYENQGNQSVAMGLQAGFQNQGDFAFALGSFSGYLNQGEGALGIGSNAGGENQGLYSTSINSSSGQFNQGDKSIAIGFAASQDHQGNESVGIGCQAAQNIQGAYSIAIGSFSAQNNQGINCIAIGQNSGYSNQHNNTTVISSDGTLNTINSNSTYISPIRNDDNPTFNTLTYDIVNKELVYNSLKTFVIQHPKYKNKYLVHACLEGSEAGVYYRGEDITDDYHKEAKKFYKKINLPEYSKYWTDFTIQITPITKTIFDNSPKISTTQVNLRDDETPYFIVSSKKKTGFFWLVNAKRSDINVEPYKSSVKVVGDEKNPYKYIAYKNKLSDI